MAAHAASASASASPFFTQYLLRLKSLTTTDAALIESLTRIADEHADSSKEVVKAMEQHLRQLASGDHRLPLLYLIDSLCRNLPRRDFPKRFDPLIRAMIESTTKRASKKVQSVTVIERCMR
jgi:hypothetical protein